MNLSKAIEARHTLKVLADPESPWDLPDPCVKQKISELLAVANNAPYHKPADKSHLSGDLDSPVPWRFHVVDASNCRSLAAKLTQSEVQSGKIGNMLSAADVLVMTTWLPNPSEQHAGFQEFEATLQNMEHIAAGSAAIQNFLLLATAAQWNNYWSSGGVLRSEMVYQWLKIPPAQVLLGAIFLFPADTRGVDVKPGGLRDRKGDANQWSRWAEL